MIARPPRTIPVPDAVADLAFGQLPKPIRDAREEAYAACVNLSLCHLPRYGEGRQNALADIAAANKALAAHNPGLVVGWGDLPGLNWKEMA